MKSNKNFDCFIKLDGAVLLLIEIIKKKNDLVNQNYMVAINHLILILK